MNRLSHLKRFLFAGGIGLLVGCLGNRYLRPPAPVQELVPTTMATRGGLAPLPMPMLTAEVIEDSPVETLVALQMASVDEIRRFLGRLDSISSLELIEAMRAVAFRRWFGKDSAGAWMYAQQEAGRSSVGDRWITAAVSAWAEQDPHAVAAAIADADFPARWKEVAESALIERLVDSEPELALTLARKHGIGPPLTYSSVFSRLASRDPIKASRLVEALPLVPASSREWAINAVALEWARSDGPASLEWFTQFTKHPDFGMILGSLGAAWAEYDSGAVLAHLGSFPSTPRGRGSWLGNVLAACWQQDPQGVEDWLENHELGEEETEMVQRRLVQSLSRVDPKSAAALDAQVSASGLPSMAWDIGDLWAREDANGTLEWAKTLPRGRQRDNALMAAQAQLAQQDPNRVLKELPAMATSYFTDESPGDRLLSKTLIRALASHGLDGTTNWLERLPKVYRRSYWDSFAKQWAAHDPRGVIDYLLSQETEGGQVSGIQTAIHEWAQIDPEAVASQVLAFTDIETRNVGAKNLVSVWRLIDPGAAQAWVEQLPDSDMRLSLLGSRPWQ